MLIDIVEVLEVRDRPGALERLANRLDGHGRAGDTEAAAMLAATAGVLMALER